MLKSRETFVFEGSNVTIERKKFPIGEEMVFIIHNGDEKIYLHDFYRHGNSPKGDLRGEYSKVVVFHQNQQIIRIERERRGDYNDGIQNPSLDHGIERWVPLVQKLYAAYRQHHLPQTEDLLNRFPPKTLPALEERV